MENLEDKYKKLLPPQFLSQDLYNKKVILRADLNISETINPTDDINSPELFKLKALLPTIDSLIEKNSKILILTHRGRPQELKLNSDNSELDQKFSTKPISDWLNYHGYPTVFVKTLEEAQLLDFKENRAIILVENLRFWPEEQNNNISFAKALRQLGDYYINDAWGVVHRENSSTTLLAQLFSPNEKSIGLLINKELSELHKLKYRAPKPLLFLLAGAKLKTKFPLIESLIELVDTILLAPTLSYPFDILHKCSIKSENIWVEQNVDTQEIIKISKNIIAKAEQLNKELILPIDYQASRSSDFSGDYFNIVFCNPESSSKLKINSEQLESMQAVNKLSEQNILKKDWCYDREDQNPESKFITTIGPESVALYNKILSKAGTIFVNGIAGFSKYPETETAYKELLTTVAKLNAYKVVGGGDSVAAVNRYGLSQEINFCSTGGGSTLTYLAGQPLPGLLSLL